MKARLILEDGSEFAGISIGASGERIGQVVLNTAVVGYQELMTDPANAGKLLVLTYPLIGNYGVAKKFNESKKCWLAGLAIKEPSRIYSNWQAEASLQDFLKKEDVLTISDIDTRTLAITIRDKGELMGIISTTEAPKEELLKKLSEHKKTRINFIKDISTKSPVVIKGVHQGADIAILDLGVTNGLIKQLAALGCNITVLSYDTGAKELLSRKYDGIIISNGPENDASLEQVADTVRDILGKVPMMGIALGHQVIALALGAKLNKLKIGHHGVNYPIKPDNSLKGEITVQNHSYIVDEDSIKSKKAVTISARNINDNSIEELESKSLKFISTQYSPVSPGFDEVSQAFIRFLKIAGKSPKPKAAAKNSHEVEYAKA